MHVSCPSRGARACIVALHDTLTSERVQVNREITNNDYPASQCLLPDLSLRLILAPIFTCPAVHFASGCLVYLAELEMVSAVQGKRTLDFVLKNRGMIDKTLLFDIELIKIF